MALKALFSLLLIITSHIMLTHSSTELSGPGLDDPSIGPIFDCLAAIKENIRLCSNESVAFFADGTIYISPSCCEAITIITNQCGPAVLLVFGLDLDHADILGSYCGDAASLYAARGPVPGPVGRPVTATVN